MRCRPNDLAVIVRPPIGFDELLGRPVIVRTPAPVQIGSDVELPGWRLDERLVVICKHHAHTCDGQRFVPGELASIDVYPDAWLRPLRDTDGVDEALQIFRDRHDRSTVKRVRRFFLDLTTESTK